MKMTKRVAVLGFFLESNNFSPVTTEEDYRRRCYFEGEEILEELNKEAPKLPLEVSSFKNALDGMGVDWELIPCVVADAEPGGPIEQSFFEETLAKMRGYLEQAGPLDGVYVASHGAMRATGDWDPDATMYAMVRDVVGPDVPFIATLDLHTNVSASMAELTDVLVSYITNPHVDQRERAAEAANIMVEMWDGMKPQQVFIKVPIAAPTVTLLTAEGPYADLINYGQTKVDGNIVNVSVTAGFIYSDSPKCGMSVIVSSRNDPEPAKDLAKDIAGRAWADRSRFKKELTSLEKATELAVANGIEQTRPQIIMADVADNPGGGGSGNTTFVAKAFTDADVQGAFIGLMIDAGVAAKAHEAGVGGSFQAEFNANGGTDFDDPLSLQVTVQKLTDGQFVGRRGILRGRSVSLGPCALLRAGGVLIGVASHRKQCADPAMVEQFDLDIADLRTIVVKSRGHFRAGFDEYFSPDRVYEIDCKGLTSPVLSNFNWSDLVRPVYPLDEETTWSVPEL
jgi:microcystin degradation protein MlrC